MADVTLKPCPFCGGAAEIERMGSPRVSMIIRCEDCGASLETGEEFLSETCRWNTRPAPQPSDVELLNRLQVLASADPQFMADTEAAKENERQIKETEDAIFARMRGVAVPEGWKLVLVMPDPKMLGAFWRQKNTGTQEIGKTGDRRSDYDAYASMLAAAPKPEGG